MSATVKGNEKSKCGAFVVSDDYVDFTAKKIGGPRGVGLDPIRKNPTAPPDTAFRILLGLFPVQTYKIKAINLPLKTVSVDCFFKNSGRYPTDPAELEVIAPPSTILIESTANI